MATPIASTRMFGRQGEQRQSWTPPKVITKTTPVWELYNFEAEVIDRELIKDWSESLNTLLIFAALYSGVLTAFIIESMKLLQPDSGDSTTAMLLRISQQLADPSTSPFTTVSFIPPSWAVRVNYCFFTSISLSLAVTLAAVLAIQWVGSYDRGLSPSCPEDRALARHLRSYGAQTWRLDQIIASLPAIVFASLFIFSIGLAEWLWHIHRGVAAVVIAGTASGATFFWITTVISVVHVTAPFRTPFTRTLPLLVGALRYYSPEYSFTSDIWRSPSVYWAKKGLEIRAAILDYQRVARPLKLFWQYLCRFCSSVGSGQSFEPREKAAIVLDKDLRQKSLLWLARSITITPDQRNNLIIIIQGIMSLSQDQLFSDFMLDAPWLQIFSVICQPYFGRKDLSKWSPEEKEEIRFIIRAIAMIGESQFKDKSFEELIRTLRLSVDPETRLCAALASWRNKPWVPDDFQVSRPYEVARSYELALQDARELPSDLLRFAFTCISKDSAIHSNFHNKSALHPMRTNLRVSLNEINTSKPIPYNILEFILDLVAITLCPMRSFTSTDALHRYVLAAEHYYLSTRSNWAGRSHASVIQHISSILYQTTTSDPHNDQPEIPQLGHLLTLVDSPLYEHASQHSIAHILACLAKTKVNIWSSKTQCITAELLSLVLGFRFEKRGWQSWWIEVFSAFDTLLLEDSKEIRTIIMENGIRMMLASLPRAALADHSLRKRLFSIRDPCIKLMGAMVTSCDELVLQMLPFSAELKSDPVVKDILSFYLSYPLPGMDLLRQFMLSDPGIAIGLLERVEEKLENASYANDLLREPVLRAIFANHIIVPVCYRVLQRISKHDGFTSLFRAAGGESFLARNARRGLQMLRSSIRIVREALSSVTSYNDVTYWLEVMRYVLISTGQLLKGSESERKQLMDCTGQQTPQYLRSYLRELVSIHSERLVEDSHPATISQAWSSYGQVIKSSTHSIQSDYASAAGMDWNPADLQRFAATVDEVRAGLRRGYIGCPIDYSVGRFRTDPLGGCLHRF